MTVKDPGMLHRLFLVLFTLTQFAWAGPLHDAAAGGNLDKVKEMVEIQKMKVDSWDGYGVTPLHRAASAGYNDLVVFFLTTYGIEDITDQGTTPLMKAAANGRGSTVKLLLERGADRTRRNKQGKAALDLARANGDPTTIKLLSP